MSDPDKPVSVSYAAMLYKICQVEGIELKFLCNNWVKRLEKSGQVKFINGYKFGLNSYSAGQVADDKYATYEVLELAKIPVVEHLIIYTPHNQATYALGRNSLEYVLNYLAQHANHIVLKPNCGTGGASTFAVRTIEGVKCALTEIFQNNPTACMSPFHQVKHEYRAIMLDGEARLTYRKTLASEKEWRFNLAHGALAEEVPAELREEIIELAKRTMAATGLRFGSVDIVETIDEKLLVLEVNSGVMTSGYLRQHPEQSGLVAEIYRDAIRRMFEMT